MMREGFGIHQESFRQCTVGRRGVEIKDSSGYRGATKTNKKQIAK
jgi:hypothetical protein